MTNFISFYSDDQSHWNKLKNLAALQIILHNSQDILLRKLKEASYPWGHIKIQTQLCLQILGIKKYRHVAIWSSVSVRHYC